MSLRHTLRRIKNSKGSGLIGLNIAEETIPKIYFSSLLIKGIDDKYGFFMFYLGIFLSSFKNGLSNKYLWVYFGLPVSTLLANGS